MWELLAAQVTDDSLHFLLVHHGQVDLDVGRRAESLAASRTELVLHLRPVPYLEVLPQTLGLNDLAALDANALSSNNAVLQFLVDPLLHVDSIFIKTHTYLLLVVGLVEMRVELVLGWK